MTTRIIVQPSYEPITLPQAKLQIKSEASEDDALVAIWIKAARSQCELILGRSIMRQTRELVIDDFPGDIELFYPPVVAVESVKYFDVDGVEQTVSSANYVPDDLTDIERVRFWIKQGAGFDWPAVMADAVDTVRVRYRAGFTDASAESDQQAAVPAEIKQWMLIEIARADQQRTGKELGERFHDGLLDRWRVPAVG